MSEEEKCKSCFQTADIVPVKIRRGERGSAWEDSTLMRCANDECWNMRVGSRSDRLAWVKNVYDYKYFGGYELSPEQLSAVYEAYSIALQTQDQSDKGGMT